MDKQTLFYAIALSQTKGIGPGAAKNLIAYLGSPEAVFREKDSVLCKIPGIGISVAKRIKDATAFATAEKELLFIEKNNIHPIYFTEKNYPFRLKECVNSPILLYARGNLELNSRKYISVVGTRDATVYGKNFCREFVASLSKLLENFTIISGMAYGIDISSHKSAIENNVPTIGVLGHGFDRWYPAAHRSIALKILERDDSGFITEYVSGSILDKSNFVQRNRIVAGLCDALIVVESGAKGGSLISAEMAFSYNRDVFAVPGRIDDKYSIGCNRLIKQNKAAMIESAADLIQYMNWHVPGSKKNAVQQRLFVDLSEEEEHIVSVLTKHGDGIQINELALILNKPYSKLSSTLLEMEFKDIVNCHPGGVYKLSSR
ncbi:MAG: DNA-processing protein DprA [Prevotellaceae bacterium]|nr:DNA-processing protein DprA [Prevotellaceae bacterium]